MDAVDHDLASLGALLVEDGELRRIIKAQLGMRSAGLRVPHHHTTTVDKTVLERMGVRPPAALAALPARVIVITGDRPRLATADPDELVRAWRAIFHGRIHLALDELRASGALGLEQVRARIDDLGQTEFDEIRAVLRQEDLLVPPADDLVCYVEFVALYLELQQFAPHQLPHTFPALTELAAVDAVVGRDLDPAPLLAAARLPRAPATPPAPVVEVLDPYEASGRLEFADRSARKHAVRARGKGNLARAAIYAARAGDQPAARIDLAALVDRLARALGKLAGEPEPDTTGWVDALLPVVDFAGTQRSLRFNVGARLLYDLQTACVVAEREVKVVDVVTWMTSLGTRRIVRALPATREVRMARHLRHASAKVAACELERVDQRARLADVLHEVTRRGDANVRAALRPKVEAALHDVGLVPHSLPERVAEKKLVDELLDRAVAVGRLTLGDLRDAISRNDLKLPNFTLDALGTGDQLLRADRKLTRSLDGVYRRGEIYLRFLQKLSSVVFGTPVGRFLTQYALLPLLASFAIVEGLQHMVGPVTRWITGTEPEISTRTTLLGGAGFLFLLLHVAPFRRGVVWSLRQLWRGLRVGLVRLPAAIWHLELVRRLRASQFTRWVLRPAIPAAIVFAVIESWWRWPIAAAVLIAAAIAANSQIGRHLEERFADWLILSGRQFTTRFLPGLLKLTIELFGRLADLVDRALYRVDELLRFRTGQSAIKLVIKGALGTVWYVIAYLLRLYVDLFIEPTTNPIKHFPVVTVAAKIILPFTPAILSAVSGPVSGLLGSAVGNGFAAFTVLVLPGLAGFLVWELKENWKLYRATRAATLGPLLIGQHGETMVGFLRPGFHSGTIPKLFMRRRRAAWRDDARGITKQNAGLHHVEEAIAKFADRQLVSMLIEVESFRATDVELISVAVGSNRVQITLACPSIAPTHAVLRFELQSGWIVAQLATPGWTAELDAGQRSIFEIALAGFYKLSGVDLVRDQLARALRHGDEPPPPYDVADEGLVVWLGDGFATEAVYDLRAKKLTPVLRGPPYDGVVLDLGGRHAIFGREPLYWSVWSTTWQQIARGEEPMQIIVGPSLLPASTTAVPR